MHTDPVELEACLKPTVTIDAGHPAILRLAGDLVGESDDDADKARSLFCYVRDSVHYNVYMISTRWEDFVASTILAWGRGYCVQKAVLLAALARAAGIPSRLGFARIKNHRAPRELVAQTGLDILPGHGYAQLHVGRKWISVTPAFDKGLCGKTGVPVVEFDGTHDAFLSTRDLAGEPYIDYIEKYEPQADLPFEWLQANIMHIWGGKRAWAIPGDAKGHRMPSGYVFH
jgi:transglutaminase-like putative cysteine protease